MASLLALLMAALVLVLSEGAGGRFVAAAGLVVFSSLLVLSWSRRLDERSQGLWGLALGLSVILCALQAWDAGSVGLSAGTESRIPWLRWLLNWPGTGLVTMLAVTGLRVVNAPRSPATGRSVWIPFGLALLAVGALLYWEGRPRILEASLVLGLLLGGVTSALRVFRGPRAVHSAVVLLVLLTAWSYGVRGKQGAGSYLHPDGLELSDRLSYEIVDGDLQLPSALCHSPDGRIFVADFATDTIWVYAEVPNGWERTLFAHWPKPSSPPPEARSSEAGLWGLVFDPDGGWLYAMGIESWSSTPGPDGLPRGVSRILRFEDQPGGSPPWKEVARDLPAGRVHSGGAMALSKDGALYVSVGEGGFGGPGQQEFVGSILELKAEAGGVPSAAPRVYARGLRNPYGLSFAPNGTLYATENGPDCCDRLLRVEEGDDFGWRPRVEGEEAPVAESAELWSSGASRIGPTGLVAGNERLHFVTWHTVALHEVDLDPDAGVVDHRLRFAGQTARPPESSVYRFAGGFTGLSAGPDGTLWFTALGVLGRFEL